MYLKNGLFSHFLALNICFTKRTRKLEAQNMVRQLLWYFWAIPIKISDLALTSILNSNSTGLQLQTRLKISNYTILQYLEFRQLQKWRKANLIDF